MNRKNRIRLALAAGAAAAVAYGSYATVAWLAYGHARRRFTSLLLDRYIPEPEVVEHHQIDVEAPAEAAYQACRNLDLMRSVGVRALFAARARLMGLPGGQNTDLPAPLLEVVKTLGWVVLDEIPGREIVVGAATRPWEADPRFRPIAAERFGTFDEPGWAMIVWNFSVEPVTDWRCIVHTETRVTTTDAESRRRFRRYWSLVSPGIVLIRLLGLRIVKADAELLVKPLLRARSA